MPGVGGALTPASSCCEGTASALITEKAIQTLFLDERRELLLSTDEVESLFFLSFILSLLTLDDLDAGAGDPLDRGVGISPTPS